MLSGEAESTRRCRFPPAVTIRRRERSAHIITPSHIGPNPQGQADRETAAPSTAIIESRYGRPPEDREQQAPHASERPCAEPHGLGFDRSRLGRVRPIRYRIPRAGRSGGYQRRRELDSTADRDAAPVIPRVLQTAITQAPRRETHAPLCGASYLGSRRLSRRHNAFAHAGCFRLGQPHQVSPRYRIEATPTRCPFITIARSDGPTVLPQMPMYLPLRAPR